MRSFVLTRKVIPVLAEAIRLPEKFKTFCGDCGVVANLHGRETDLEPSVTKHHDPVTCAVSKIYVITHPVYLRDSRTSSG